MKKYVVIEDTLVLDKGEYYEVNYRFEEVDRVYHNAKGNIVIEFEEGEPVIEPDRTPIGKWLLSKDKLKYEGEI